MIQTTSKACVEIDKKFFSEHESIITIKGFKRAYGVNLIHDNLLIPDFLDGLIYEINLSDFNCRKLTLKDKKLREQNKLEKIKKEIKNHNENIIQPHDIYVSQNDKIYITDLGLGKDQGKGKILVFDSEYNLLDTIGTEIHDNLGLLAPVMIYEKKNFFYITEYGSNKILRFDEKFSFLDWIGTEDEKFSKINNNSWNNAKKFIDIDLLIPHAIKIDLNGLIYIADSGNHRILRYDSNGNYLGWIGKNDENEINNTWNDKKKSMPGIEPGAFKNPLDLFILKDSLLISEVRNNRISKINLDGKFQGWLSFDTKNEIFYWSKNIKDIIELNDPYGFKVHNNSIFIADRGNNRVLIIKSQNLFK